MSEHESGYDIGMVGLGVMGRNFLLNLASHGFSGAGFDKDAGQREQLRAEAKEGKIAAADTIPEFIGLLRIPRVIMLLVPAGHIVDSVIDELLPHIQPGDLLIDGGNSYFKDTSIRMRRLNAKAIEYLGVGISGGEEGARLGPSIMPGGSKEAYENVHSMFESAAAKVDGEPCVIYLGPDSAGHYVKMVHNGIEYASMQLIAESYDLMKRGLGMDDNQLHDVFSLWNEHELKSYLIEITSRIFSRVDTKTGSRLIDEILDVARQKGTGMWASQSAMELHVPTPTIDVAVTMRDFSGLEEQRSRGADSFAGGTELFSGNHAAFLTQLERGLYAGMVISYAQGMHLLNEASVVYHYGLDMESVARIWRGGCIIRARLLDDIASAFHRDTLLPNLILDPAVSQKIKSYEKDLRATVGAALAMRIPVPGLMSAVSYLDAFRSAWLPANLIQAQRDYFGAHTYERIDAKGTFHTQWNQ
jgi:6-phosphogluconate dehydrogenase